MSAQHDDDPNPTAHSSQRAQSDKSPTPVRTSLIPQAPQGLGGARTGGNASDTSTAEDASTLRWVDLCECEEVVDVGLYPHEVTRDGYPYPILLIRTEGGLYGLHDECPHRQIAISEMGYLEGEVVRCGWHHWGFHVESGDHIIPTGVCVDHFKVKEEGGRVLIGLPWPAE